MVSVVTSAREIVVRKESIELAIHIRSFQLDLANYSNLMFSEFWINELQFVILPQPHSFLFRLLEFQEQILLA